MEALLRQFHEENRRFNSELKDDIEQVKAGVSRVEAQVEKTNGRVTVLELWRATVTGNVKGGWAVAILVGAIIGFLAHLLIK